MTTLYNVATTAEEYYELRQYALEKMPQADPDFLFDYPTVYAKTDGVLSGLLARQASSQILMVGKLISNHPIITLRMVDFFEGLLRKANVLFYWIPVDEDDAKTRAIVEKVCEIVSEKNYEGISWYKRELSHDG